MGRPVIVWLRQDLRLSDNPALDAACASGDPVIVLYIHDDAGLGKWKPGGASRWWLHHSLAKLGQAIEDAGSRLVLRSGPAGEVLDAVVSETGATAVNWNRCYEPEAIKRDTAIKASLAEKGITVHSFNARLLVEPWNIETKAGEPYKVFTPFWRAQSSNLGEQRPLAAPNGLIAPENWPASDDLDGWGLVPSRPDWAGGLRESWMPGEAGAQRRLYEFIDTALAGYARGRNIPSQDNTSRLSPHLHFGEISPRQIFAALAARETPDASTAKFRAEIGWREFSYHLLYHFPDLPEHNLRAQFDGFPWAQDADLLGIWQRGETGYPIVDAGMRQLWQTGWMHNRVRMICASFLVKHLLQPWQAGAEWFWDTLVDADLANNSASWQWVAGCGADAAPYFRIFNPVLQGEKFDPRGEYVRRFVPEVRDVPDSHVHKPYELDAPPASYPAPVIGLKQGRDRALAAYQEVKGT